MPCYDSRNEPDEVRRETKKEFQAELDDLTALLCEANQLIDDRDAIGYDSSLHATSRSRRLAAWWREHQKLDRRRRR